MNELLLKGYGIYTVLCIAAIVFLIVRRQKLKKKETFEKRDN